MHAFLKRDTNCFMCVFWINFMSSYKIRCHLVNYTLLLSYFINYMQKKHITYLQLPKKNIFTVLFIFMRKKKSLPTFIWQIHQKDFTFLTGDPFFQFVTFTLLSLLVIIIPENNTK